MPWSNQGGGPWGPRGGSNGPWGRGPSGGGSQGPDLEDILRRGQDRMRTILPGNMGGRRLFLAILAIVAIWLSSGFYTVAANEQGVVLRFGEYVKTTQPGLNYHLPWPIERNENVLVEAIRRVEIGFRSGGQGSGRAVQNIDNESLMLTGDENIIDINFVAQWNVKDAAAYAFNVRNPEQTVMDAAMSAMREVIGHTRIAEALAEGRREVASQTEELLQAVLDEYSTGIHITQVNLQRADPPQAVIDDYRDVQRARADMERLINEAKAYQNRVVPEANGRAAQLRQEAQAYKEQVVARADGAAQRFDSVYAQYRNAKDVTRQRIYLETMEGVFRDMEKVIIDSSDGSSGVVPYLPLPELQKRVRQSSQSQGAEAGVQ